MLETEFLQPDNEEIRHQIRGVLDSYSHEWDLLSELLQNSVDAIREKTSGKGHISLLVDAPARIIRVRDNGVGINPAEIARLLRPFGTNKSNKPKQIGEKGVGLKFVMFSSSKLKVSTNGANGPCTASIVDAASWLNSENQRPLLLTVVGGSEIAEGTEVEITIDDENHPVFNYSFFELLFLLRTRTACGDTGFIWDDLLDADTKFTHIDKGGKVQESEFECRYLLPTECANKNEYVSIDDFQAWLKESDRSDTEKRRRLMNKIVFARGKKRQGGREIRYWSCFVPRREFWKALSQNFGIEYPEDDGDLSIEELLGVGFSGGFSTSTKGMPTGISIEMKPRGSAGYVPNFFIIVDDPSLRFDIGRKSIQGRQQGMLREIAYENFREYINRTRKYMGGAVDSDATGWDRDELFEEINELPDLGSDKSRFLKRPNSQEATVAAMFFEQIGRGEFQELYPLISGYKGRYDLYAKWKNRRVVLEFKYDLAGLFRDFSDEKKMFDEINVVVIWEVTENDRILAARRAMTVEEVEGSSFAVKQIFPGVTKTLSLGDVNPINVIELKPLLGA
ncbi:ATP-binding protein [Siccirubricoccus sp. G192]|uniref:ATP-binding protein n=1 Tax=Siccirubricoccus sp. G192 TaxID=2849651 RepID=UPI001C2CBF30|nr:ATP-binding protein [Siccirubricoccus sp. G192]MBV1795863.1 ATP-binding protein [Siccirubricoccus sp. G192]